jgi:hypothetical protein
MSDSPTGPTGPTGPSEPTEQPEASKPRPRPQDSPYLFTIVLAALGLWFFYDGFFNPEIESVTFNRVGAGVLLGWAAWDFHRMRQKLRKRAEEAASAATEDSGSTGS